MTSNRERCANCGFENAPDASRCAQCDAPLRAVTTMATPAMAGLEALEPLTHPHALSVNEVMFIIAGHSDPVIVTMPSKAREILIGRGVRGETPPNLDLAAYSEAAHSISRRHARLDFSGEHATITDLGSTNGSWLNENRLTPHTPRALHNGDLVRVGQQFMFVYFASVLDAIQIITLTDTKITETQFTPGLMARQSDYLQLLTAIQNLCNQARQQQPKSVSIKAFNLNHAPQTTKIRVADAPDALLLITSVVNPWRDQHRHALAQADDANPLWEELAQRVHAYLTEIAPDLAATEHEKLTQQLLPHLRAAARHNLELALAANWD